MDDSTFFLLFCLGFVIFMFARHSILSKCRANLVAQLDQNGIWAIGSVLKLQEVAGVRGPENRIKKYFYYVEYQYQANGDTYKQSQYVAEKLYDQLGVGCQVDVLYLPDQPDKAMLTTKHDLQPIP